MARKRREKQAKLDAWKFEFVLDKNVSSVDDKRFSVARRMYKVNQEEENKVKRALKRFSHVREYEMTDLSSTSSEMSMSTSDSDLELLDRSL